MFSSSAVKPAFALARFVAVPFLCFSTALSANSGPAVDAGPAAPESTETAALYSDMQWTLAEEEDGMKVFTGDVAGSDFKAVRVVANVNAPVQSVVDALGDGSECAKWRGMCESSQVLEVVSEHERLVHMVLDLPWPISDRDAVIRSVTRIDADSKSATIDVTPAPEALPEQDHIRAVTNAQFALKVISDELVELTYTVHAELGGDLSPGMINPRLAESTIEDVERLVALAEG
jgi:START domain